MWQRSKDLFSQQQEDVLAVPAIFALYLLASKTMDIKVLTL